MPFFSIVIPVYNRADLITATLNSVLKQEFKDYEIVIVNDGSTDNTEEIIKLFLIKNDKVKYLWQKNSERGTARNLGFQNASGRYVVFLDSDDLMNPDHLETLYKKIIEQNFPNFITTKYLLRRNGADSKGGAIKSLKEKYYDINLQLTGAVFACNLTVKRNNPNLKLFIEDRRYAVIEDWIFLIQNLEHDRIYLIDANTIIMIDHDDRSMRKDNPGIIKKHLLATDWIEKNTQLATKQKKILWGHSFQFCAIHSYLDGKKMQVFKYISKSIPLIGINKMQVILMIKSIIGYKLIQKLK